MKAKVLVKVDRDGALKAIHVLDAFRLALRENGPKCGKKLKRSYKQARQSLLIAIGSAALNNGVSTRAVRG